MKKVLIVFSCLTAVACTPAQIQPLPPVVDLDNSSSITVYREGAVSGKFIEMIVGLGDVDYFSLDNDEYSTIKVSPGNYSLFVRSDQADSPDRLDFELAVNEQKCFLATGSQTNWVKAFFPFTWYLSSTFTVKRIDCLSDQQLKTYVKVAVGN